MLGMPALTKLIIKFRSAIIQELIPNFIIAKIVMYVLRNMTITVLGLVNA